MLGTRYGNYIITELKPNNEAPWTPVFKPEELTSILFLDSQVVKGAFCVEAAWIWPPFAANDAHVDAHTHGYDEVLAYFGSNPENPRELYAEIEVPLGDEKHIITKSCLIYIPKGLQHGPIRLKKMEKPIFHFTCGTGKKYF